MFDLLTDIPILRAKEEPFKQAKALALNVLIVRFSVFLYYSSLTLSLQAVHWEIFLHDAEFGERFSETIDLLFEFGGGGHKAQQVGLNCT